MAHLDITALGKRYGGFIALDQVDLAIERGEFVVLLGPSGCGKTTLLRAIAGLERQDEGRIVHAGRDISDLQPGRPYRFSLRPEDIRLHDGLEAGENSFLAQVEHCEFLGAFSLVTLRPAAAAGAPTLVAQFSSNYLAGRPVVPGSMLRIGIPPEQLRPMPEAA